MTPDALAFATLTLAAAVIVVSVIDVARGIR